MKDEVLQESRRLVMAAIGVEVYIIQLIGRWGGQVVLRYVQEAPLVNITEEYRSKVLDRSFQDKCRELVRAVDTPISEETVEKLKGEVDTMKESLYTAVEDFGLMRAMVSDDIEAIKNDMSVLLERNMAFVRRTDVPSSKWHPVVVQHPSPPSEWRTECGWRFAGSRFTSISTGAWPTPRCDFCVKVIRRREAKHESSHSLSSEGSSST